MEKNLTRPPFHLDGSPRKKPKGFSSFRTKFIAVAGVSVLIGLVLSSGVAVRSVVRLGDEASGVVEYGLTVANQEYLDNYLETTEGRINLILNFGFGRLDILHSMFQTLVHNPEESDSLARVVNALPMFEDDLMYNPDAGWYQSVRSDDSLVSNTVVSVWSALVEDGEIDEEVKTQVRRYGILDLALPSLYQAGGEALYFYIAGPRGQSYLRLAPYLDMATYFDENYPEFNGEKNDFWDYFFPGLVESWVAQGPEKTRITVTAPYEDAAGGGKIISCFYPVWDREGNFAGAAAMDYSLNNIVAMIEEVELAETGFAFLSNSGGDIVAVNDHGERILGLSARETQDQETGGTEVMVRNLGNSQHESVRALRLPKDDNKLFYSIEIDVGGNLESFFVVMTRLRPVMEYTWDAQNIGEETWTLAFVVPEKEIYASLNEAKGKIKDSTKVILYSQTGIAFLTLGVVLLGVMALSKRMTAGLTALAQAAEKIENQDYSVRADVRSNDEIGSLGVAFNSMAKEIEIYTQDLEQLVRDRTRELEAASEEIRSLNVKLRAENKRMGAELEVVKQLQSMVLPKQEELKTVPDLDIAGYMKPADEVGGDYYDVLQDGRFVRIGIGDVTGHGLESGVLMIMVQTAARTLTDAGVDDPAAFLSIINRVIYKNVLRIQTDKNLSLLFVDFVDSKLRVTGQHEEMIVLRENGHIEEVDTIDLGFPVGLEEDIADFVFSREVPFGHDDIAILFTDGITEAQNEAGEFYGMERLCESIRRRQKNHADDIKTGVISDLTEFIGKQKIYDDITLVVIRCKIS